MKPNALVLVIGDERREHFRESLGEDVNIVFASNEVEALRILRTQGSQSSLIDSPIPTAGDDARTFSSQEILERLISGIAILDQNLNIRWHNRAFAKLCQAESLVQREIYSVLECDEIAKPNHCPFTRCLKGEEPTVTRIRLQSNRHVEIRVQQLPPADGHEPALLCILRDITSEVQAREKMTAIHRAGLELAHLTPIELAQMSTDERTDLLKANILQHAQKILNFRFLEVRVLDPANKQLKILLSEGMTEFANRRQLFALPEGNGVTGFVAATATSYRCDNVNRDPHYLPGAPAAKSSLTVPMMYRDRVIGTFNVESTEVGRFTQMDQEFLEIFAREIAVALHTLDLLQVEKQIGGSTTVDAIVNEVSLPADAIISDAIGIREFLRQSGNNPSSAEEIVLRIQDNARNIKISIQKVGQHIEPGNDSSPVETPTILTGKRILIVDADPNVRRSAHVLLSQLGCEVDSARDGAEASQLVRTISYDTIVGDIRLDDMKGYDFFKTMTSLAPQTPVVLMTGFGYDAHHSIVRAKQEGLASVLYKPFRLDRIREAVADAVKIGSGSDHLDQRRFINLEMGSKQTLL